MFWGVGIRIIFSIIVPIRCGPHFVFRIRLSYFVLLCHESCPYGPYAYGIRKWTQSPYPRMGGRNTRYGPGLVCTPRNTRIEVPIRSVCIRNTKVDPKLVFSYWCYTYVCVRNTKVDPKLVSRIEADGGIRIRRCPSGYDRMACVSNHGRPKLYPQPVRAHIITTLACLRAHS